MSVALKNTLKPKLDFCLKNCKTISFTDCTGLYSLQNSTNLGGYANTSTPYFPVGSINFTSAIIEVYNESGDLEFSYDVTSQIPSQIGGVFTFNDYIHELKDGEYEIKYTVTDVEGNSYLYTFCKYIYCNLKCCIDKAVSKIPEHLCDCDTTYIDNVLFIKSLELGLQTATVCEAEKLRNKIKDLLARFCDLQCGC